MGFGVARSVRHTLEQAAPTEAMGQRRAGVVIQALYMHKGVREDGHPPMLHMALTYVGRVLTMLPTPQPQPMHESLPCGLG